MSKKHLVIVESPAKAKAIGKYVGVIGGANTARDTARAAKRGDGVEHV